MRPTLRSLARSLVIPATALALGCGGDDCGPSEPGCGGPVTYSVRLSGAPADLGALMVSLSTSEEADVLVRSGRGMPGNLDGSGTRRAILVGVSATATLLEITFQVRPLSVPVVSILDAAANQGGGYAVIQTTGMTVLIEEASTP